MVGITDVPCIDDSMSALVNCGRQLESVWTMFEIYARQFLNASTYPDEFCRLKSANSMNRTRLRCL